MDTNTITLEVGGFEVDHDTELFADQMAIEMTDGYEWRGPWLLAYSMFTSAAQLNLLIMDPSTTIKRMRAGSIAYRCLNKASAAAKKHIDEVTEDERSQEVLDEQVTETFA